LSKAAPAVHAIVGDRAYDSFLAEEALEAVLAEAVGPERADAVEAFRGEEATWARVLDAARTRSLFAARRAVVVRGADALKGEPDGLEAFLGDPTPGVVLVLLAAKPDRRRSVWKKLLDGARVVKAEPLKGAALRGRVQEELRRRKLKVPPEALEELIDRVGQDLRRLMGELDKLEAFAQGRAAGLTAEEVAGVLGRGLSQPIFKLSDAFAERNARETLELAEALLDEGEEAVRILGVLHRALRQVRAAAALRGQRLGRDEVAARLGLPPNMAFKAQILMDAARAWSEEDLRRALTALMRADRELKTGGPTRAVLGAAVLESCGKRAAARPARPSAR
jgi:DNA polymerase III subunit delta